MPPLFIPISFIRTIVKAAHNRFGGWDSSPVKVKLETAETPFLGPPAQRVCTGQASLLPGLATLPCPAGVASAGDPYPRTGGLPLSL